MTGESENGRKRATIWDVAHAAGVSHQTVSRYLRNEGGLRPATREKIDKAVKELDYKPNLVARSMRTRRTNRIAIVLPELTTFVPIPVLRGASGAARAAGYTTDVVGLEGDETRRAEGTLSLLDSQQVEGVLSFTPLSDQVIEAAGSRPIVVYGEYDDRMHARGDLADGRPAGMIVRHLAELGHRRFLHVAGSPTGPPRSTGDSSTSRRSRSSGWRTTGWSRGTGRSAPGTTRPAICRRTPA